MKWLLFTILFFGILILLVPSQAQAQQVSPAVDRALNNVGAYTQSAIQPPGAYNAVPPSAGMDLGDEPAGPVIEVEGEGVKAPPQPPGSVGPLYGDSVHGQIAPR